MKFEHKALILNLALMTAVLSLGAAVVAARDDNQMPLILPGEKQELEAKPEKILALMAEPTPTPTPPPTPTPTPVPTPRWTPAGPCPCTPPPTPIPATPDPDSPPAPTPTPDTSGASGPLTITVNPFL